MIILHRAPFGTYRIVAEDGRDLLVQDDRGYPSLAGTFGWNISDVIGAPGHSSCYHDGTDGTIDCQSCGRTAAEFISAARQFLDNHDGAIAEDPGYFLD